MQGPAPECSAGSVPAAAGMMPARKATRTATSLARSAMLHNSILFLATQTLSAAAAAAHHPAAPESRQSPVPANVPASSRPSAILKTDDGSAKSQSAGHPATTPQWAAVPAPDLVDEQADNHSITHPPDSPPSADASPLQQLATAAEPSQDRMAPHASCAAFGKPHPVSGATDSAVTAHNDHTGQQVHPPGDSCALPEPSQAHASCDSTLKTVCGQDQQLPEVSDRPDPGWHLEHTFPIHGSSPQVAQPATTLQAACTSKHAAHNPTGEADTQGAANLENRDPGADLSRAGRLQSFPGQQHPLPHASCKRHAKDPQELTSHESGAEYGAQQHWHVLDTDKCPAAVGPTASDTAAEGHARLQPPAPQHHPPAAATAAAAPPAREGKRKPAADARPPAKLRRTTRSQMQQPFEPADSSLLAPLQEVDELEAQAGSPLKEDAASMDRPDAPCTAGHANQVSSCSPPEWRLHQR